MVCLFIYGHVEFSFAKFYIKMIYSKRQQACSVTIIFNKIVIRIHISNKIKHSQFHDRTTFMINIQKEKERKKHTHLRKSTRKVLNKFLEIFHLL